MCIPSNMAASDMCIPYPPPLQTSACFVFVIFFSQNICIIPFRLKQTKGTRFLNAWKLLSSMHILYCLHAVPLYKSSSFLSQENNRYDNPHNSNEPTSQQKSLSCQHRPQCGQHSHPFVSISLSDTVVLLVVSNDCNCGTFL